MKKKIIHLIYSLEVGGAERDLILKVNELSDEFDFIIVVLNKKGDFAKELLNIPIYELNMASKFDAFSIFKFYRILFKEKADILHCHLFNSGLLGRFLAIPFKIKKIYTVQMIRPYRPLWQKIADYLLQFQTSRIIAASKAISDSLKNEGIRDDKIEVIYNSVNIDIFRDPQKQDVRSLFHLPDDSFIVGSVSRLNPDKGIDFLIESAALLKEYKDIYFIVFGDGEERKRLEEMIKEYHLEEKFILPGYTESPPKVLGNLDIFVLPSRTEGLGISIIEAQAAGLSAIASKVGGIPEIIEDGKNGLLFEMGDVEALKEKIIMLYEDNDLRKRLSENARENSKRFEKKHLSEELKKIYLL